MTSNRIDPSSLLRFASDHVALSTDSGEILTIDDLVSCAERSQVADLIALHAELFPDYGFVASAVEDIACSSADSDDLVPHQLLVTVEGIPAGFVLFECNLRRRVAAVLFLGLTKEFRRLQIDGRTITEWLIALVLAYLDRDLDDLRIGSKSLGLVGEAVTSAEVRLWGSMGLHLLPVASAEPAEGRRWREVGLELRDVSLVWLPPYGLDDDGVQAMTPVASAAGAAAFLLDYYGLPSDLALVIEAVGDEASKPGIERRRTH